MRAAALVLSAFSGCLMVYSIYCKSKEDMLGVQAAGNAFALAASLLSGCWVAVILSALAIVRNLWTVGKTRKYFVVAAWVLQLWLRFCGRKLAFFRLLLLLVTVLLQVSGSLVPLKRLWLFAVYCGLYTISSQVCTL